MGRKCDNCGYEVRDSAKFCPNCGKKVESEKQKNEKVTNNKKQHKSNKKQKGRHLVVKSIAGMVGITLLSVGGYIGYQYFKSDLRKESKNEKKEEKKVDLKKIPVSAWEIRCIGASLPQYTSVNEISNEELEEIYTEMFDYYITENHYRNGMFYTQASDKGWGLNDYDDRRLISDEQFIEKVDNGDSTEQWIFKASALDKFNQLAGIEFNPENLDKDRITYDGEKFVVTFTEERLDPVDCDVISVLLDDKKEEIIVNLLKKETGKMEESSSSIEHAVIVPADNDYGYKVKCIEAGAVEMPQTLTQIESNADWYDKEAIFDGFENYSVDESNKTETIRQLAMLGKNYADGIRYDVVNTSDKNYSLSREMFYDMCEVMGISREESNVEIQDDEIVLNSQQYEINISNEEDNSVNRYLLRDEYYKDKNEGRIYYLITYEDENNNITDYLRQVVVIQPENNIFGYKIKEISTEEWRDEYSSEIKNVEDEVQAIEEEAQYLFGWDGVALEQQERECWVNEMECVVAHIEEKYPDKKELIEANQKDYWDDVIKEIEGWFSEAADETEEEQIWRQEDKVINEEYRAKARAYYLIGNVLMDGKLEEMLGN